MASVTRGNGKKIRLVFKKGGKLQGMGKNTSVRVTRNGVK